MPFTSLRHRIAYFDVPKSGSTTLKHVLFELENGQPFQYSPDLNVIHQYLVTTQFNETDMVAAEGLWKFCVVRDPISRILAVYGNKVVHYKVLEKRGGGRLKRLYERAQGMTRLPSLDEFCTNLSYYRSINNQIKYHTQPLHWFLGAYPSRFDAIYRLDQMGALQQELRARTGEPIEIPRLQTGGPKFRPSDLSDAAFESLVEFTRPDYRYLDGLFTLDDVVTARRAG